ASAISAPPQAAADAHGVDAVIDEAIAMGTRRFLFTGSGEPFLYPGILDLMRQAKEPGSYTWINTNGTLLDRATIDRLVDMDFDCLVITTLAGTAEMYARTHPGSSEDTFDLLRDRLLYLADRKRKLGKKRPAVNLCFIILRQNCDGLLDFARFCRSVEADTAVFRPFDDVQDAGLEPVAPTAQQAAEVRRALGQVRVLLERAAIRHNIDALGKVFGGKLDTRALYSIVPCYYGWLMARINTDGNVYPCCRCYEPLGNIREMSFREIWWGEAYRQFRRQAITLNQRSEPLEGCVCYSCVHHTANLRVYRALHPLRGRSRRLRQVAPSGQHDVYA
ncbi:MAG: SPASM domain-containing protein, partial [Planctomycetota bacterium]